MSADPTSQCASHDRHARRTYRLRDLFILISMLALLAAAVGYVYRSSQAASTQTRDRIVFPSIPMADVDVIVKRGGWVTQNYRGEVAVYFARRTLGCGRGAQYLREFGNIATTRVTFGDDDVPHLLALGGLHYLDLSNTAVTDRGLASLADHPSLESLELIGLDITGAGLDQLQRIKSLKDLIISCSRVSQASLTAFTQARPDVRLNGHLQRATQIVESPSDTDESTE